MDLLGRLDEAARLGEAARKVQPDDRAVIDLQLSVYSQQGQWDKIRLMLQRRELSLNPASAAGLTYAEALLRLDHPEHARAILSKALIIEPGNRYARMMLGEAQLATGDARSALTTLRPLVEGVFVYPREFELAERAAVAAGDPLSAVLSARRKSGELSRRSTLIEQGLAATARSNWPSALAAWQQLQSLGEDAELLRRIADCASLTGAHALAITSADKAAALKPGDAELLHLAGAVRLAAGLDPVRARTLLEAAVELAPANPQFRADLARARGAAS
jgi:tetratricopeptide (TPR) repeat protein